MKFPPPKSQERGELVDSPLDRTAELIERLIKKSSGVLVKKLAMNDWQWAVWDGDKGRPKSKQGGPLFPALARTSRFFPELHATPHKLHNFETFVKVLWPTIGRLYTSKFSWYSEKGDAENHFTRNPIQEFRDLSPASYLLIFRAKIAGEPYQALTVDSADDDLIEYISQIFHIGPEFHFQIFNPNDLDLRREPRYLQEIITQLIAKLNEGPIQFSSFVSSLERRRPSDVARDAYQQWLRETGADGLHPFKIAAPGDVLLELTKVREFNLYKLEEAKTYGAQLARAMIGEGRPVTAEAIIAAFIQRFEVFYDICKSAKQARASRAGGSFESHMSSVLLAGGIPHQEQFIFDGSRPDFILPTAGIYVDPEKRKAMAAVLTLKTTLRERWRQVVSESIDVPIFLATLDENVAGSTLGKLEEKGITLIVPEAFKTSKYTEYQKRKHVLSYRQFFDLLQDQWSDKWLAAGIDCFGIRAG